MEEEGKGILIAHSICPYCLIPGHCSTNSYWIKPFILRLRHMAFSITYPCVTFICCRIKRDAQLIQLNLLLFQAYCFLSCQSQTVLNMGLITGIPGGLPQQGVGIQEGSESQQVWIWTQRHQLAFKQPPAGMQLHLGCRLPRTSSSSCPGPWHGSGIAGRVANLWVILSGVQVPATPCEVD